MSDNMGFDLSGLGEYLRSKINEHKENKDNSDNNAKKKEEYENKIAELKQEKDAIMQDMYDIQVEKERMETIYDIVVVAYGDLNTVEKYYDDSTELCDEGYSATMESKYGDRSLTEYQLRYLSDDKYENSSKHFINDIRKSDKELKDVCDDILECINFLNSKYSTYQDELTKTVNSLDEYKAKLDNLS